MTKRETAARSADLAEAHLVSVGPVIACPQCHRLVPQMPFCPCCGIASRATPKLGRLAVS